MTQEEAELTLLIHKLQCETCNIVHWYTHQHQLTLEVALAVDLDKIKKKSKMGAARRYGMKARALLQLFDFHTCKKILEALK